MSRITASPACPKESIPKQYPDVAPEIVIEVRSPSDRWREIHAKVAEYLDRRRPGRLRARSRAADRPTSIIPTSPIRTLGPDDELTFPECLPDFRVPVRRFFE